MSISPSSTDNVPVQPLTPNSKAVTPLHAYDYIIATQHPDLHLTLTGNSVYLKPIPVYMLYVDFWRWLAVAPNDKNQATYKAAMGFMRTYCLLVRYASDFRKAALIHELIPRDLKVKITYESFVGFISQFANVPDSDVAPRYTHGELALRSFVSPHRLFLEAPEEDETEDGDNEKERTENQPASASSYKSWSVSSGPVTTAKADDPSTLAPSLFELSSMLFLLFFWGAMLIWSWTDASGTVRWLVIVPLGLVFVLVMLTVIVVIGIYVEGFWVARKKRTNKMSLEGGDWGEDGTVER